MINSTVGTITINHQPNLSFKMLKNNTIKEELKNLTLTNAYTDNKIVITFLWYIMKWLK